MFDSWESVVTLLGVVFGIYGVILWLGLVVWTYRDIRERTHDNWSQTVAVLLVAVLFVPGLLLYLLLRPHETLSEAYERRLESEVIRQEIAEQRRSCPTCQKAVREEFLLCPNCRTSLREPCVVCSRPLEMDWTVCPFCGAQGPRPAPASTAGRPPEVEPARATSAPGPPAPLAGSAPGGTPTPTRTTTPRRSPRRSRPSP